MLVQRLFCLCLPCCVSFSLSLLYLPSILSEATFHNALLECYTDLSHIEIPFLVHSSCSLLPTFGCSCSDKLQTLTAHVTPIALPSLSPHNRQQVKQDYNNNMTHSSSTINLKPSMTSKVSRSSVLSISALRVLRPCSRAPLLAYQDAIMKETRHIGHSSEAPAISPLFVRRHLSPVACSKKESGAFRSLFCDSEQRHSPPGRRDRRRDDRRRC